MSQPSGETTILVGADGSPESDAAFEESGALEQVAARARLVPDSPRPRRRGVAGAVTCRPRTTRPGTCAPIACDRASGGIGSSVFLSF
jgi:hypothetical protein